MTFSPFIAWCTLLLVGLCGALPVYFLENGAVKMNLAIPIVDWSNSLIRHISLLDYKGPELTHVALQSMLLTFFGKET